MPLPPLLLPPLLVLLDMTLWWGLACGKQQCHAWYTTQALVSTALKQREAKRYEDAIAGRYKPAAPAALAAADAQAAVAAIEAEADKARRKQERLRAAVEGLAAAEPVAAPQLERALAHAAALEE
jgi:hypothetical protein